MNYYLKPFIVFAFCLIASTHAFARTMAYISNADDGNIVVYELNADNGTLSHKQTIAAGKTVMPLTVSPDQKKLYASIRSEPYSAATFSINQESGLLERLSQSVLPDNSCFILIDNTNNYLLSASYQGSKVAINKLNPIGVVAKHANIYPTGLNAHALLLDSTNQFLFITNLGDDQILQMRFDEKSGTITPNTPSVIKTKVGAGPRHLRFSPDNRFVYVLNELDGTVNMYSFNKYKGTLQEEQTISIAANGFIEKPSAAEIQISPNGKFVYTSERNSNTLTLFQRNEDTGHLTYTESTPTEVTPRGFTISPDGQYLLAAGQSSSYVSIYKITPNTGHLNFIKRYAVGGNPNWIEILELK